MKVMVLYSPACAGSMGRTQARCRGQRQSTLGCACKTLCLPPAPAPCAAQATVPAGAAPAGSAARRMASVRRSAAVPPPRLRCASITACRRAVSQRGLSSVGCGIALAGIAQAAIKRSNQRLPARLPYFSGCVRPFVRVKPHAPASRNSPSAIQSAQDFFVASTRFYHNGVQRSFSKHCSGKSSIELLPHGFAAARQALNGLFLNLIKEELVGAM